MLERLFEDQPQEQDLLLERPKALPARLRGSYYLIGPALFHRADLDYRHWLDGDGLVCALHFQKDRIRFVTRFVRSDKWRREAESGAPIFRTFGTSFPEDRLLFGMALEPVINVNVLLRGGRLLAFGEQGLPWALNPADLTTVGRFDFDRKLNRVSPFAAHPKIDPHTGEMVNFGVSYSASRPALTLYVFDQQNQLKSRRSYALPFPASIHDFGLSPRFACFHISPYQVDMEALAEKGTTLMDALRWEPEKGSFFLIIDRDSGEIAARIPVGSGYCLHFINCWEADGRLWIDLLEMEEPAYPHYDDLPNLFQRVKPGRPVRYAVELNAFLLAERRALDYDRAPDFAAIDPADMMRPYENFWCLGISATGQPGRKFFDELVHCRWDGSTRSFRAPSSTYFGGEPVFIPDPSGRGGLILCPLCDAANKKTSFLFFDAFDLDAGPVARVSLDHLIPPLFHSGFFGDSKR